MGNLQVGQLTVLEKLFGYARRPFTLEETLHRRAPTRATNSYRSYSVRYGEENKRIVHSIANKCQRR